MSYTLSRQFPFVSHKPKPPDPNFEFSALPGFGTNYLDHLIGEFVSLKGEAANNCACQLGQQIVDKARQGKTITWGDTYILERAVFLMLPDLEVHQRIWCVEARYREAAGNPTAYDNYLKLDAQHLGPEEKLDHARARLDNLIRELYRLYTVIDCRQEMRKHLSKVTFGFIVVLLSLVALVTGAIWYFRGPNWTAPFAIVFAAGCLGGAVSYVRRLQSLPTHGESLGDLVELTAGSGVYSSPVLGGLFASVLYIVFAAGLVTGTLFPALVNPSTASPATTISEFLWKIQPLTVEAWAKLLVWSFVAGFAERFVPDTLDHLIARSQEISKKEA
jgi:hypothetical protein